MRGLSVALCFAMIMAFVAPAAARAGEESPPQAELDGRPLPATDAGKYFCHDFNYPLIRCYSTARLLEESLAAATSSEDVDVVAALVAYGANDYVTIYSEAVYAGAYAHLSQNYDALWVIGWNDRISSFKARNSQSGRFWHDWYATGLSYAFCCNSSVSGLGSHNNTFSSVYRNG